MLTSFFDLLTNPIITLFIPLLTVLLLKKERNLKSDIFFILKLCISWGIGYILMWALKWTLADLIYQKGTWENAINQIFFRINKIGYTGISIPVIDAIKYNFLMCKSINLKYLGIGIAPCVILPIIYILYKIIPNGKIVVTKKSINNSFPFFLISISPIIWYLVVNNHSYYHWFFTYRNLSIFLIGFNLFIIEFIQVKERVKNEKTNKK